eukprot:TRINITY_DN5540_c0_g1_i1.p1 TRINITY_DN5540_c0_g1~~TRINITY_DN5540_c0_g1_i1.p1  ORF type:complete len:637 (-),score=170.99 TRINITY_DN5540_c0_g1_i1:456-2366(-)
MIRRPPRSTLSSSSAASDVYKRQYYSVHPTPMTGISPTTVPRRGARSNHAGAGRWAVALLVAAASMATLCRAGSLPTDVVVGHTDCVNIDLCNVPGDGSTLQVEAMTANAKTAGNATATFKTQGTQFSGKLTVDCLTTDPWVNDVSLAVEIRDGARVVGTLIPIVIEIKGVLRLGSSILIINGTYDFGAAFLVVTYFGVVDSSSVVVTGLKFEYTTVPDSVMKSSEPLVVTNGSRIEISHTSHALTSLTRASAWAWYVFNSVSSITINNGTVALVGNSYTMKSMTSPVCDMGMMSITTEPLTITEGGTLLISDNSIDLNTYTASTGAFSVKMLTQSLATALFNGSTVRVTNNNVKLLTITAGLIATLVTVDTLALNADAATVDVRGNVYDVSTLTAAGIVVAFLRPTNYLTTNGTTVDVSGNGFIRNNVVVSSPTQSSVALVGGVSTGGIYVHSKSMLRIGRNSITDGPQSSSAFDNVRFVVAGGMTQTDGGIIDIMRNHVVFSTVIATLFTLTTDNAAISVCLNFLQQLPCRSMSGGLYSCAQSGATNVVFTPCNTTTATHSLRRTMSLPIDAPTTTNTNNTNTTSANTTSANSTKSNTNTGNTTSPLEVSSVGSYASLVGTAVAVGVGCVFMAI